MKTGIIKSKIVKIENDLSFLKLHITQNKKYPFTIDAITKKLRKTASIIFHSYKDIFIYIFKVF